MQDHALAHHDLLTMRAAMDDVRNVPDVQTLRICVAGYARNHPRRDVDLASLRPGYERVQAVLDAAAYVRWRAGDDARLTWRLI